SISSRTSSEARSDTCVTASASVVACWFSAAKALQQEAEGEAAGEGGADGELGTLVERRGRDGDARGRREGERLARLGGERVSGERSLLDRRLAVVGGGRLGSGVRHSGGSSPNARIQIIAAIRCVAMLASAPRPASKPDQTSRLTRSLSAISSRIQSALPAVGEGAGASDTTRSRPPQIVSTMWVLACSYSRSPVGSNAKIQPVSTCSTAP